MRSLVGKTASVTVHDGADEQAACETPEPTGQEGGPSLHCPNTRSPRFLSPRGLKNPRTGARAVDVPPTAARGAYPESVVNSMTTGP